MDSYEKYLKYKMKYINLKNQIGGDYTPEQIKAFFNDERVSCFLKIYKLYTNPELQDIINADIYNPILKNCKVDTTVKELIKNNISYILYFFAKNIHIKNAKKPLMDALKLDINNYGSYGKEYGEVVFNPKITNEMVLYDTRVSYPNFIYINLLFKSENITYTEKMFKDILIKHLKDFIENLYKKWQLEAVKLFNELDELKKEIANINIQINELEKEKNKNKSLLKELKDTLKPKLARKEEIKTNKPYEMIKIYFNYQPGTELDALRAELALLKGGNPFSGVYTPSYSSQSNSSKPSEPFTPYIKKLMSRFDNFLKRDASVDNDPAYDMDKIIIQYMNRYILYLYLDSLKDIPSQISVLTTMSSIINNCINDTEIYKAEINYSEPIKYDFRRIRQHIVDFENNKKAILSKFIKDNIFIIYCFLQKHKQLNTKDNIVNETFQACIDGIKLFLEENLGIIIDDIDKYIMDICEQEDKRLTNAYFNYVKS